MSFLGFFCLFRYIFSFNFHDLAMKPSPFYKINDLFVVLLLVSAVCPLRTPYYTGFKSCTDSGDCGAGGVCCLDMAGRHYCYQLSAVE